MRTGLTVHVDHVQVLWTEEVVCPSRYAESLHFVHYWWDW